MSSEVRPIRAASHKEAANQGIGATNRRKPDPPPFMLRTVRESQPADRVQGMERLTAQPVEAVSPEMEPTNEYSQYFDDDCGAGDADAGDCTNGKFSGRRLSRHGQCGGRRRTGLWRRTCRRR